MLRIVYMGTPNFAVPALTALSDGAAPGILLAQGYEIVTVVTRPDKPAGRGRDVIFSPVKQAALERHIPVWQPGSFKKTVNSEALAAYKADLYIVAAFGQILPQSVLDQPRYGTLNIHASLLSKYRGPNPITETILQGDTEAGVTIMQLDAGIDTGQMLLKRSIPVTGEETTGSLTIKLANLGAEALLEALPLWIAGRITPEQQDENQATHTHMQRKEDGLIDWERGAAVIARQVRAYTPWPSAYTYWRGKLLKIISAQPQKVEPGGEVTPGTAIVHGEKGQQSLTIVTGSGLLSIKELQIEGKKAMKVEEFLRGYAQIGGQVLGK